MKRKVDTEPDYKLAIPHKEMDYEAAKKSARILRKMMMEDEDARRYYSEIVGYDIGGF